MQKEAGESSAAEEAAPAAGYSLLSLDCSLLTILSSVLPLSGLAQGLSVLHADSLPQKFACWLQLCFHKCAWPSVTAY